MPKRSTAEVQTRRREVAALWLRGVPPATIAEQLQTPEGTVKHDLKAIRDALAEANRAHLEANRDRSIAVLREVQAVAWQTIARLGDASMNKVGALNTIIAAEEKIARMQGTLTPDVQQQTTINVLAVPEWQAARSALLAALGPYPEAKLAVADALARLEAPPVDGRAGEVSGDGK